MCVCVCVCVVAVVAVVGCVFPFGIFHDFGRAVVNILCCVAPCGSRRFDAVVASSFLEMCKFVFLRHICSREGWQS